MSNCVLRKILPLAATCILFIIFEFKRVSTSFLTNVTRRESWFSRQRATSKLRDMLNLALYIFFIDPPYPSVATLANVTFKWSINRRLFHRYSDLTPCKPRGFIDRPLLCWSSVIWSTQIRRPIKREVPPAPPPPTCMTAVRET